MAGIYIHIPFCRQACHYCNFHFSTSLMRKNDFVAALLEEIDGKKAYLGGERVETIYFGGGTPSLLSEAELKSIMERLHASFSIDPGAEITLEANPDDVMLRGKRAGGVLSITEQSEGYERGLNSVQTEFLPSLESWRAAGINRLSLGIQSFSDRDLQWMNRAHTAGQALASIEMAKAEGFDNISIDLIYGSPMLTDEDWARNVEQAVRLNIPHLSCYALTVEPRTALDKMIHHQKSAPVDPDAQARQFTLLMGWLETAGYEHYEISNFALSGKRSRHNSSYWKGRKYLGLGPSAHSYDGLSRQWNVANNALYMNGLTHGASNANGGLAARGEATFEREVLTSVQQLNEYIMISLRTMEGCDTGYVSARFGEAAGLKLMAGAARYVREGKMRIEYAEAREAGEMPGSGEPGEKPGLGKPGEKLEARGTGEKLQVGQRLVLTREGKLLADGIAAELFQ